jgi:hypothetical protein
LSWWQALPARPAPEILTFSLNPRYARGDATAWLCYPRIVPEVIVPVLNEATALPALLSALPAGYQAIVVDNGSTDGSAEVAARAGARSSGRTGAGSARPAGPG